MKNLFRVFAFMTVLSFSQSSLAGLLIEPFLGYYSLTTETEGNNGSTSLDDTDDGSNSLMGARLGYTTFGFGAGLDHTIIENGESDIAATGLFLSYKFPILVRAYATYFASVPVDGLKAGTGTKIGFGFTGLPFVHINLEMYSIKWDDKDPAVGSGNSFESNMTGTALVISLPFDI